MRLFLAIELSGEQKAELAGQLEKITKDYPDFSWVAPENYHITVHFIGETDQADEIKKKIGDCLYDQEKFYLYSHTVSVFIRQRITIYLDFHREKALEKLAGTVRYALGAGDSGDRYIPHLTLARYRIPSKQQYFVIKKKFSGLDISLELKVNKIVLYESLLGGKKPVYRKLAQFPLL